MLQPDRPLTIAELGNVVVAAAAVISLLLSIRANRISAGALRLAQAEHELSEPKLSTYLIESVSYPIPDLPFVVYAFAVSLTNPASAPNTVSRVDLLTTHRQAGDELLTWCVSGEPDLAAQIPVAGFEPLTFPCRIEAHGSVTGWVFYRLGRQALHDMPVHSLELSAVDVHQRTYNLHPIIVRELTDDTGLA